MKFLANHTIVLGKPPGTRTIEAGEALPKLPVEELLRLQDLGAITGVDDAPVAEKATRKAQEKAEAERKAAEQVEADRKAAEQVEADRKAAEQAEADRAAAQAAALEAAAKQGGNAPT